MDKATEVLIDSLISSWSDWDNNEEFYLGTLVVELLNDPKSGTSKECEIFEKINAQLDAKEIKNLAELIKERRAAAAQLREQKMEQRRLESIQKEQEKVEAKQQYDVESEIFNQERLETEKKLAEERRLKQLAEEKATEEDSEEVELSEEAGELE